MLRLALAAWLALTVTVTVAVAVAEGGPFATNNSLPHSTTTSVDPWSSLLADTEGAPSATEPKPGAAVDNRRRGRQSLVESIRTQLMRDNYDYVGKYSAEAPLVLWNAHEARAARGTHRQAQVKMEKSRVHVHPKSVVTKVRRHHVPSQHRLYKRKQSTVPASDTDSLYYSDDNYLHKKALVSGIPFRRRSKNITDYEYSGEIKTQPTITRNGKPDKQGTQEYRRPSLQLAPRNIKINNQHDDIQGDNTKNISGNRYISEQRDKWNNTRSDENKTLSRDIQLSDYSNEIVRDDNGNVLHSALRNEKYTVQHDKPGVKRRMNWRAETDDLKKRQRKRKKRISNERQKLIHDKAMWRRDKLYSDNQQKTIRDEQKYIRRLKKYNHQRNKHKKYNLKHDEYRFRKEIRRNQPNGNNKVYQRQQHNRGRYRPQHQGQGGFKKDYVRNHMRGRGTTVDEQSREPRAQSDDENYSQIDNPNNHEQIPQNQDVRHDSQHDENFILRSDDLNDSLTEDDEHNGIDTNGQQDDQEVNEIDGQVDDQATASSHDENETEGNWKQYQKDQIISSSLERDIRNSKQIVEDFRRADTALNEQIEVRDAKHEDRLNDTQLNSTDKVQDNNNASLLDHGQNDTQLNEITTSTPYAKYKLIKVHSAGARRNNQKERQFLQERREDGVALIPLDDGPFPQFRLPRSRRQYMLESHHKLDPLKDQLPKSASLTNRRQHAHNQLN